METGVVLLCKLSLRSIMKFGRYPDITVQKMIDLGHTRVLRYYYYTKESIDFLPEVKELIGISPEYSIEKPGIDLEMNDYVNALSDMSRGSFNTLKASTHAKRVGKARLLSYYKRDSLEFNRGALCRYNHGHR